MNIYALKGHKVIVTEFCDSLIKSQVDKQKLLELGKEYTIEKTEVHSWHTDIYLQEFPQDGCFNSVIFESVTPQSSLQDKQHPDWARFNK